MVSLNSFGRKVKYRIVVYHIIEQIKETNVAYTTNTTINIEGTVCLPDICQIQFQAYP